MIEDQGKKNWIGKLIRKRKKKSKVDQQIIDTSSDIQKLIFILQIISLQSKQISETTEKTILWVVSGSFEIS